MHSSFSFLEYVPVMCQWRWNIPEVKQPDFLRTAVVHLKVADPENKRYSETVSDGNVQSRWLEYNNITSESFMQQCNGKSKGLQLL